MNRKILPVTLVMLLIAITTICYFKYVEYKDELSLLQAENYNLNDKIKYLNEKTKDLEKEIENLDSKIYELENNNRLYQDRINLKNLELSFDKKRLYETEVFYEFIKNSEFEDNIISTQYYKKPSLTKVRVSIKGTNQIIDFLQHISNEYTFYYFKKNI